MLRQNHALVRLSASVLPGALLFAALLMSAKPAHADVSSWLFTGVGPSWEHDDNGFGDTHTSWQLEAGMGTDPGDTIVVGGLLRLQPYFGLTTDMGLLLRTATHGFVNGDWGLALDLGGYLRLTENHQNLLGSLVLGAPWGITLSVTATRGPAKSFLLSPVLGIDFARLTVYRTTGSSWWKNPLPAYRPEESGR